MSENHTNFMDHIVQVMWWVPLICWFLSADHSLLKCSRALCHIFWGERDLNRDCSVGTLIWDPGPLNGHPKWIVLACFVTNFRCFFGTSVVSLGSSRISRCRPESGRKGLHRAWRMGSQNGSPKIRMDRTVLGRKDSEGKVHKLHFPWSDIHHLQSFGLKFSLVCLTQWVKQNAPDYNSWWLSK